MMRALTMSNIHNDAKESTQDLIEQVASMGNNLLINQLDNVIDKLLEHKFEEQAKKMITLDKLTDYITSGVMSKDSSLSCAFEERYFHEEG